MKSTRFTETQIVKALKEHEAGRKVEDLCRELEISKATLYNWKSKYGGMDISDVKRLKELEDENARLKRMYANLSLDHEILKDIITKKGWALRAKGVSKGSGRRISTYVNIVSLFFSLRIISLQRSLPKFRVSPYRLIK